MDNESADRVLTGARWSSAVRCVAKAIHEHIGTPRDEDAQFFLEPYFARGRFLAEGWVERQRQLAAADGKTVVAELEVPWGPPGFGWTGHADFVIPADKLLVELYHARDGEYLPVKALQAAGYATRLDYEAVLVVFDANDIDEEKGIAIHKHRVPVAQLKASVKRIENAVVAGARRGFVKAADRVGETPSHSECLSCPFRTPCWEGWKAPPIDELVDGERLFDMARVLEGDRQAQAKTLASTSERLETVKAQLRDHLPPGEARTAGGIRITRKLSKPSVSFAFGKYRDRRLPVTPRMREFVSEGKPRETWIIEPDLPEGDQA